MILNILNYLFKLCRAKVYEDFFLGKKSSHKTSSISLLMSTLLNYTHILGVNLMASSIHYGLLMDFNIL